MKVTLTADCLTDRVEVMTLHADTFPEERFLSLIRAVIETNGEVTVECGSQKLIWLPGPPGPSDNGTREGKVP